jgi:hypothetical protein
MNRYANKRKYRRRYSAVLKARERYGYEQGRQSVKAELREAAMLAATIVKNQAAIVEDIRSLREFLTANTTE